MNTIMTCDCHHPQRADIARTLCMEIKDSDLKSTLAQTGE